MKQEPNSRGLGIPRLQAGEQVNGTSPAPNKPFVFGLNRPNSAKPARPAR